MRPPNQSSGGFVGDLRTRIDNYFDIVLRSCRDSIPKAIGFFLVRSSQQRLQFELYKAINENKMLTDSLGEPQRVTERRKQLNELRDTLNNSLKVLQRDPDIQAGAGGDEELEAALKAVAKDKPHEADPRLTGG